DGGGDEHEPAALSLRIACLDIDTGQYAVAGADPHRPDEIVFAAGWGGGDGQDFGHDPVQCTGVAAVSRVGVYAIEAVAHHGVQRQAGPPCADAGRVRSV